VNRIRLLLIGGICLVVGLAVASTTIAGQVSAASPDEADADLIQLILDLLGDPDKEMRSLGLEQIRTQAEGRGATLRFAAHLPKLSADAQVGLLRALAERRDEAARPAVLERFESSRLEPVRVAAIGALSALGDLTDVERLVPLLVGPSGAERAAARSGLISMRGEKVPKVIAGQIMQVSPPLAVALLEILVARRALDETVDILPAALADDPTVRTAAMAALGQLAGPEHLSALVRGVLRADPGRERSAAEKAVLFVCNRIEDPQQRAEPLLAAIDELGRSEQMAMLSTMGRIGGGQSLKRIEAVIADGDSGRHELGVRALCNWPNASIASRLIELAEEDDHRGCRTTALRALIRIAPLRDSRSDQERLGLLKKAMAMAERDSERTLVLQRARAIRTMESLEFLLSFVDDPTVAEVTCESIIELAHHRGLREPNKPRFDQALDQVLETTDDATLQERATRYKQDRTWVRPAKR
jgi:HEAT repeat protein